MRQNRIKLLNHLENSKTVVRFLLYFLFSKLIWAGSMFCLLSYECRSHLSISFLCSVCVTAAIWTVGDFSINLFLSAFPSCRNKTLAVLSEVLASLSPTISDPTRSFPDEQIFKVFGMECFAVIVTEIKSIHFPIWEWESHWPHSRNIKSGNYQSSNFLPVMVIRLANGSCLFLS